MRPRKTQMRKVMQSRKWSVAAYWQVWICKQGRVGLARGSGPTSLEIDDANSNFRVVDT
jgi:hypothetical protein